MLTGDAGREALQEVIDYAPFAGLTLPGIRYFQVPHHGGRHNVSTEILDQLVGPGWTACQTNIPGMPYAAPLRRMRDHPRKSVIRAVLHRGGHWAATESKNIRIGRVLPVMAGYQFPSSVSRRARKLSLVEAAALLFRPQSMGKSMAHLSVVGPRLNETTVFHSCAW